ncbi:hypothetical protein [Azospirillum argentinense]
MTVLIRYSINFIVVKIIIFHPYKMHIYKSESTKKIKSFNL